MPDQTLIRAACIQLNSGADQNINLARVASLIEEAAEQDCELLLLPENFSFMGADEADKLAIAEKQKDSAVLAFLADQAREYGIVIVGGSVPLKSDHSDKIRNSCPVFSPAGECIACYDKIHLFDVDLPDEHYCESESIKAGRLPEHVSFDGWNIGLSICYDLRFPELYRHYSSLGCNILTVPAAFTVPTGQAHWETLLRARAIENQAYVLAAGQCGTHPNGRKTWGHSMMINPWGEVIASFENEVENREGIIVADFSLNNLNKIRQTMPVLDHRRL